MLVWFLCLWSGRMSVAPYSPSYAHWCGGWEFEQRFGGETGETKEQHARVLVWCCDAGLLAFPVAWVLWVSNAIRHNTRGNSTKTPSPRIEQA